MDTTPISESTKKAVAHLRKVPFGKKRKIAAAVNENLHKGNWKLGVSWGELGSTTVNIFEKDGTLCLVSVLAEYNTMANDNTITITWPSSQMNSDCNDAILLIRALEVAWAISHILMPFYPET